MTKRKITPGISRTNRISDEGLQRLENQLSAGRKISNEVLTQWIKRYGEKARALIKKYGLYDSKLN